MELRQLHLWTYEEKCHIMESFGTTPLALHIFTVLQASLTFRFFFTLICGGLRVFKWFFRSFGIHSTIASVIGAVSCRTDCVWVFFADEARLWQWFVCLAGGCSCLECGRGGSQKKVCCCLKDSGASRLCSPAVLWDQMLDAQAVCATRFQEVSLQSFCPHFPPQ